MLPCKRLCYRADLMTTRHTHPMVFMFLILPFGVMAGFLSVSVAYLLSKGGVSVTQTAALLALGLVPYTWKFAWAPIADTTLNRKTWYILACVVSATGIWATGAFPAKESSLPILSIVVHSNVAVTFLGMSVESLMAYGTPGERAGPRRRLVPGRQSRGRRASGPHGPTTGTPPPIPWRS